MLRTISRLRALTKPPIPFSSSPFNHNLSRFPTSPLLPSPYTAAPFASRRRRERDDDGEEEAAVSLIGRDPTRPPRLFVVQPRLRPDSLLDSKLGEALNLANSLEEQRDGFYAEEFSEKLTPLHLVVQNPATRARSHADTYFGPGTVENVKVHLRALESKDGVDAVFVNTILSGIQQRNLEVAWGRPVLDRVGLIIEIFNAHAETKEAKLQSELAALMYKRSRLVRVRGPSGRLTFGASGEAEVVSARGRGSGGRGFISGAGETELQLQRRRIQERRNHLLAQIEEVRRTRTLQRASRKRRGDSQGRGLATVAVVGYTNAGKSTLVSALSESDLYSDDRLFATVDPRLRSVILPSGRKALLSDTVGFISDLPIQLVKAFHATLEEVVEADLLVHVLDSSAPNIDEQRTAVLQVLQQIGVSDDKIQNMIEVWNKIDLLEKGSRFSEDLGEVEDEILDQDEDLAEGEDEREGGFSEDDGMQSELSSCETMGQDDNVPELSSGETMDEDDMASELSSGEHVYVYDLGSELSQDENLRAVNDEQSVLSEDFEITDPAALSESKNVHVKTSAVMGIGLQQLLTLIDEKLSIQKSFDKKNFEPFDRKWRPPYNAVEEKVAEQ